MTLAAVREPAESDVSSVVARGHQVSGPSPGGSVMSARVLGLQRTIGNAAVGRLIHSERRELSRACCASCGSGHLCEEEEDAELLTRGGRVLAQAVKSRVARVPETTTPPSAIGRAASRERAPAGRRRQLQRLGNTSRIPIGFPCPVPTDTAPQAVDSILFPNAITELHPHQRDQIENFVRNWEADGGTEMVRVDGFASTPGEDELNWRLSCERAQKVAAELRRGIPDNLITVFAQGETTEFGAIPQNRRATITFAGSPTPTPPPTPTPTPTPPTPEPASRSCGPAIDRQLTAVLREIQRAFHDPSVSEWQRELGCDNLVTPTPAAIMAWDIIDLFLPHTSWLRRGPCGLPRIEVEDPAGCGNTVEVDGKCHLAGTVNYAMYGIACRLCSDRHRRVLPAGLDSWSRADMRFWVAFYNALDTTGGGIDPPRDWATATYDHGPTGRPSGTSNRASCPVGCSAPPAHSTFDFAWPPIRGDLFH